MATITRNLSSNVGIMDAPAKIYNSHAIYDDHVQYDGTDGRIYSREVRYLRTQTDQVGVEEILLRIATHGRKVLDTTGVSESSTRKYIARRVLEDGIGIDEFVFYAQRNLNQDVGPSPEVIIVRPIAHIDPTKMIVYSMDNTPRISTVGRMKDIVLSGKIYDSHTFYNKHQVYYNALSTDLGPSVRSVSEV